MNGTVADVLPTKSTTVPTQEKDSNCSKQLINIYWGLLLGTLPFEHTDESIDKYGNVLETQHTKTET